LTAVELRQFTEDGIVVIRLDDDPIPEQVPNIHGACPSDLADSAMQALQRLHSQHAFAVILFPVRRGLGFRMLQARQAGLAFQGVILAAYLDGCGARDREQHEQWPDGLDDLELDYLERVSFERSDVQIACDPEQLAFVRANGWQLYSHVILSSPTAVGFRDMLRAARERAPSRSPSPATSSEDRPLVTVCVPHYNLGAHLPGTLESLAAQTYSDLEVLVIDDGSTDAGSRAVCESMRDRFPKFRFLTQPNAGIGATRNRGLAEANGRYFIPMDADNIARPELVARLVTGIEHRPELGALTCYFLAFEDDDDLKRGTYRWAYRPTGGPHVLACLRNVYGDATAIYRTDLFRAVGGYETDRHTSFEDWEAYVKLVQAGFAIDVLPEYLFFYRHREASFSRVTGQYANHERVLRQFRQAEHLPAPERIALWNALVGFHRKMDTLSARSRGLRHRLADRAHGVCQRIPFLMPALKWLVSALLIAD
jgi:glycosyltransferase involved in cell wall biosynthesis